MGKSLVPMPQQLPNQGEYLAVSRGTSDDMLIEMWLDEKSENTKEAYGRDITLFRGVVQKPLQAVMLDDLQNFGHSLVFAKHSSKARTRNAVKSLFSFAMTLGYIRFNPAAAWKTPKVPSELAARILTEEQVMTMLAREEDPRNHALLRLLYNAGLRVSELCSLTWRDVQPNATTGGQVTVCGKGDKVRSIPISAETYAEVQALRGEASPYDPVFTAYFSDNPLDRTQVYRIVSEAGKRAGVPGNVSPHWLRHAHASHALDRGAPIQLVKETLGHANIITTNNYAHARPNASSSSFLPV